MQHFETKTATFNHEGHAKARQACDALMRAMPEVAVIAAVVLAAYMAFKLLG